MGQHTEISWCDHTFNIAWGCTKVSPACSGCYAETWARRYGVGWGPTAERRTFGQKHWDEPAKWARKAGKEGVRRRVFTSSMADVFEDHPVVAAERLRLWDVIDSTWHDLDWMILTKRIVRVRECLETDGRPADFLERRRCWIGTTVENQEWADKRIPYLLKTPAVVRFLSMEPLLGPVDLRHVQHDSMVEIDVLTGDHGVNRLLAGRSDKRISWVIVGGESGPKARPMHPDWARSLRDECVTAGVPYHFKQFGEWMPFVDTSELQEFGDKTPVCLVKSDGRVVRPYARVDAPGHQMAKVGKKAAGRMLDGRTWDEFPEPATVGPRPADLPGQVLLFGGERLS